MPMTALTQSRRLFFLLLLCWLGVNLIQSVFTEINSDEAYYFMYGRWLSFGYFDHPPLVAVLAHFSSFLFEGICTLFETSQVIFSCFVGIVSPCGKGLNAKG